MKIKYIIPSIILILFLNILPVKADIAPPPFSRADMWINRKGFPVFPSAEEKKNYKGYEHFHGAGWDKVEAIPIPINEEKPDKTLFVDKDKNTVLELDGRGYIYPMNEGLIAKSENWKFGFVDTNGNWVIEPKYIPMCRTKNTSGGYSNEYKCSSFSLYFKEGLAPVKYDEKPVITFYKYNQPELDAIIPENFVLPKNGDNKVYGKIIDNKFYISNKTTDTVGYLKYKYKTGYIDKTGNLVIKTDYELLYPFSEGLALFKKSVYSKEYGYIDKSGKVVISPKFTSANSFDNGIAKVEIGTGYILMPFSVLLLLFVVLAGFQTKRDLKK